MSFSVTPVLRDRVDKRGSEGVPTSAATMSGAVPIP